jgi:hypothetical protein
MRGLDPRRHLHVLVPQHGERPGQALARRVRHDHVINIVLSAVTALRAIVYYTNSLLSG